MIQRFTVTVAYWISVRRGRGAVDVQRCGCGGGAAPLNIKKIIFLAQNDKFWGCILPQFLTDRKHGQSLEALGHGFYGSVAKRSLQ